MANLLDTTNARLDAILFSGYGTTGSFSDFCKNVAAITANHFRAPKGYATLTDSSLEFTAVDRAVSYQWTTQDDGWDIQNNTLDGIQNQGLQLVVWNGVVYGPPTAQVNNAINRAGSEVATDIIRADRASARLFGDVNLIKRALTFGELYEGQLSPGDNYPAIKEIRREGQTVIDPASGNGRLIARTTFSVKIDFDATVKYTP